MPTAGATGGQLAIPPVGWATPLQASCVLDLQDLLTLQDPLQDLLRAWCTVPPTVSQPRRVRAAKGPAARKHFKLEHEDGTPLSESEKRARSPPSPLPPRAQSRTQPADPAEASSAAAAQQQRASGAPSAAFRAQAKLQELATALFAKADTSGEGAAAVITDDMSHAEKKHARRAAQHVPDGAPPPPADSHAPAQRPRQMSAFCQV